MSQDHTSWELGHLLCTLSSLLVFHNYRYCAFVRSVTHKPIAVQGSSCSTARLANFYTNCALRATFRTCDIYFKHVAGIARGFGLTFYALALLTLGRRLYIITSSMIFPEEQVRTTVVQAMCGQRVKKGCHLISCRDYSNLRSCSLASGALG